MRTKYLIAVFMFLLSFSLIFNLVQAASISISQSGADSGTVMKGRSFTVTVSDLSSSGTVTLVLPSGFSTSEGLTKSFSEGTTSVSWTTVVANQKVSGQTISATISTTGVPETVTTSSFDVVLPPSLSATVSPTSTSVTQGSTFSLSLNIQNSGETTAQFGSISVSPSDFSISSGCSPSSISGGQSSGVSCTILASSSATTGSRTVTLTITPSNADSISKTISVTVNAPSQPPSGEETTGGGGGGGGEVVETKVNVTRGKASITIPIIAAGKQAVVNITKIEDMAVTQITISVKNSVNNIKIVITKLADKPASVVHEITGKVYHYIEINKTNIKDVDINKMKIKFKVEKTWITTNNINESTIALNRYENGWTKLPTVKQSEDTEYVYFEAESSSMSIFAITGEAKAAAPMQCPTCPQPTEWSTCTNNQQTRTNYRCSAETNYQCQSYTETKSCAVTEIPKPTGDNTILIADVAIVVILGIIIWKFKFTKPSPPIQSQPAI
jgi:PGF-pre-PGF domain-containing protein